MPTINLAPLLAPRIDAAIAPLAAGAAPLVPFAPFAPLAPAADPLLQALAPAPAAAPEPAAALQDGAAMRPDQLFMARQLAWPLPDSAALAASWRVMIKTYAAQLSNREQQARGQQLPAALFMAEENPGVLRQPAAPLGLHPDAWRFVVYAGGRRRQLLRVLAGEPDAPPGRRRRAKAALRLELTLADGSRVTLQIEPLAEGILLELCAANAGALRQLRELQPELAQAVARAGLTVLRWTFRDTLQPGRIHAHLAPETAAAILTPQVFQALAELALLLAAPAD